MRIQILASAAMLAAAPAMGQPFQRVAASWDLVPGASYTFEAFDTVATRGGRVAFTTPWVSRVGGLYRYGPEGLVPIADELRPLPAGNQVWDGLSMDRDGSIAFGGKSEQYHWDVLRYRDGQVTVMADSTDPMPGAGGTFWSVGGPLLEDGQLLFCGNQRDGPNDGIYRAVAPRVYEPVVDTLTRVPGTYVNFSAIGVNSLPCLRDGKLAFNGWYMPNTIGIFISQGGQLTEIAHEGGPAPGGGTYGWLQDAAASAGGVAFREDGRGIYTSLGGPLRLVVSQTEFGDLCPIYSLDDDGLLFGTRGQGASQLFYWSPGAGVSRLIGYGDVLDGRTVDWVNWSTNSLSDGVAAVVVNFADSTQAVYTIQVPTPGGLLALGAGAVLHRRRRAAPRGCA
jgi:hypothetical protein